MDYGVLKHLHMTCVALTFILFSLRGFWMLVDSDRLTRTWVKVVPHVVDSLLLLSAIGMAVQIGMTSWIAAKLVALVVYVVLGTIALKRGKTRTIRMMALVGAYTTFLYIAAVATTKNPLIW